MDEKLKKTYSLEESFNLEYTPPMRLVFETDDPIAFDKAKEALNSIMSSREYNQLTLFDLVQKG